MTTVADLSDAGKQTMESLVGTNKGRMQNAVRALDIEFQQFRDGSVLQESYTQDEVDSLLSGYFDIMRATLNKQHADFTIAHADVIAQVLKQGDAQGKPLQCCAAKLDAPDLEKHVAALEEDLRREQGSPKQAVALRSGPDVDLRKELQDAKEEKERLKAKAKDIQEQFNAMMRDKTSVQLELNHELDLLKAIKEVGSTPGEATIAAMKDELSKMETEAEGCRKEAAEGIKESQYFQQLKSLIQKRNEETKEVRERLTKFQEDTPNDDDDDE